MPSDRKLMGVKSISVSSSGGYWYSPSMAVNLDNNTITFGGGGSTVDTRITWSVTYTYI